ncbi:hypothetical protein U6G28_02560 [Actinomycetaceae bacterium MB13-C1-2]|nr:hypothetical protein U6G28_02560 [Actinomycetaceae bacterium MB13-C1-2]
MSRLVSRRKRFWILVGGVSALTLLVALLFGLFPESSPVRDALVTIWLLALPVWCVFVFFYWKVPPKDQKTPNAGRSVREGKRLRETRDVKLTVKGTGQDDLSALPSDVLLPVRLRPNGNRVFVLIEGTVIGYVPSFEITDTRGKFAVVVLPSQFQVGELYASLRSVE